MNKETIELKIRFLRELWDDLHEHGEGFTVNDENFNQRALDFVEGQKSTLERILSDMEDENGNN